MSELESGYRIGDVIELARRRILVILAAAVVGLIVGFLLFSSAPTTFSATSRVEVRNPAGTTATDAVADIPTQLELVKDDAVTLYVIDKLKLEVETRAIRQRITVANKEKSQVIEITFTAPTADEARDGANATAEGYIAARLTSAQSDQDQARTALQADQADLAGQVEAAQKTLDGEKEGTAEYLRAQRDLNDLVGAKKKVDEEIAGLTTITGTTVGRIVTKAPTPSAVTSKMALGKGVGAFGVFVLGGFAVAWILDRRDGLGGGRRRVEQLLPAANFRVMPNADGRSASPADVDTAIDRLAVELVAGGAPGRATSVLVIGAGNEPPVALAEELASSLAFAGIPSLFVLAGTTDRELRHAQVITSFADLLEGPSVTGPAGLPETAGAISTTTGPLVTWLRPRGSAEASGLLRRAVVEALVTRAGREKFEAVVFVSASPTRSAAGTALGQWVHRTALVVGPGEHGSAEPAARALTEADVRVTEVVWT